MREPATFCEWKILVNNYFEAHKIAMDRIASLRSGISEASSEIAMEKMNK